MIFSDVSGQEFSSLTHSRVGSLGIRRSDELGFTVDGGIMT